MKQVFAWLLALTMLAGLSACGGSGTAEAPEAEETRTVTDVWNREVEIPGEVDSIVCLGSMAPRFAAYLDVVDMMVGAEERCEEVLSYVDDCKADLDRRTREIPDEEKPKVYTGAVTFNGRHGFPFTYVNFPPFLAVHARNVADSYIEEVTGEAADAAAESGKAYLGQNGFEVDLEQILQWDPDIVFLDPGNLDLVNDEYRNNPGFFHSLRAVREGAVYTMPSTNAAGPNISYILVNAYYAGSVLYPQQFADLNFEEKAGEILEFMLGENTFEQMKADGLYYGTIQIGA